MQPTRWAGAVRWLPIWPMQQVKLPVFFRFSFLAGGLRTAITSALMQRKSMPHRLGARARADVIDGSRRCCWSRRSRSCASPSRSVWCSPRSRSRRCSRSVSISRRPLWTTCTAGSKPPAGRPSCPALAGGVGCRSATSNSLPTWRTTYDWRAAERQLNRFPQFTTQIDGAAANHDAAPRGSDGRRSDNAALATATTTPSV
jgi:hypothetical protein